MMTSWNAEPMPDRSARTVIALTLLALLLVAAVPLALLAGVVVMMLGHVLGGLALFGGSILAAAVAVALAGMKRGSAGTCASCSPVPASVSCNWTAASTTTSSTPTCAAPAAEPQDSGYANVVRLDHAARNRRGSLT